MNQPNQSQQTQSQQTQPTLSRIAKYREKCSSLEDKLFSKDLNTKDITDAATAVQSLSIAMKAIQEAEDAFKKSEVESSRLDNELRKVVKEGEYVDTIVSLEMMQKINNLRK